MKRFNIVLFLVVSLTVLSTPLLVGQDKVGFSRQDEVIYGRKHGLAMTLDVFTPKDNANGVGVIAVVSGGWFSSRGSLVSPAGTLPRVFNKQIEELLRRGYTVFAVVHGSQPKYTVPEILEDMHRAVRFVRHNASTYKVDPERLGIFGGSAGGHLSLMQGTAGIVMNEPANPVDRESSRVQAVVAYYPPTDFLNYGVEGGYFDKHVRDLLGGRNPFLAAVDFREFDNEKQLFFRVAGEKEIRKRLADISPANHVTPDDPPTLIIHGDADRLVPIQQSELIMARFKQAKVTAMLKVMPGKDHGWAAEAEEVKLFADWFDTHLGRPSTKPVTTLTKYEKVASEFKIGRASLGMTLGEFRTQYPRADHTTANNNSDKFKKLGLHIAFLNSSRGEIKGPFNVICEFMDGKLYKMTAHYSLIDLGREGLTALLNKTLDQFGAKASNESQTPWVTKRDQGSNVILTFDFKQAKRVVVFTVMSQNPLSVATLEIHDTAAEKLMNQRK